jgi:pimeloyl-ACP methyl ester carboxylesterase
VNFAFISPRLRSLTNIPVVHPATTNPSNKAETRFAHVSHHRPASVAGSTGIAISTAIGNCPRHGQGARIHQPSLFIAGSNDAVITGLIGAKRVKELERVLPNLTQKLIIEGAGHWIQQERPHEVNAALIDFVRECVSRAGAAQ